MTKFFSSLFSDRFVVRVNLSLLALSIMFGLLFYAGRLHGAGDDLNNLSISVGHGSILEYIKWFYLKWGQTGIVIWFVPIQIAIKLFHIQPEGFPWWLFASINTFCYLAAPYMLVIGGKRLLRYEWREALFILAFIYGVWLTPIVYRSTIDIPVTFLVAFALPTYLLTIAVFLYSKNNIGQHRRDWLILGCIYLLLSINTETFLLSIPSIFAGMTIIHSIQEKYKPIRVIGIIGFFATISLMSALFVWTQPGFHARPLNFDFHIPSFLEIAQWYVKALEDFGFRILIEDRLYNHLGSFIRYLFPLLLVVIILGFWIQSKMNIQMSSYPQIGLLLSKATWALILLSGFLFCMVPILFTSYYPNYTRVYPTFLMAGSLGFCLSFLFHLFKSGTLNEFLAVFGKPFTERKLIEYYPYWSWFQSLAAGVILLFMFSFNTLSHIQGIYQAFQAELVSSTIRQDFQKKIEIAYYETGQENYIVTGCPKGIIVEQYWGIYAFFYWKGVHDVFGALDTDPNLKGFPPQEFWPDKKTWYKIECLRLTDEQLYYLQP